MSVILHKVLNEHLAYLDPDWSVRCPWPARDHTPKGVLENRNQGIRSRRVCVRLCLCIIHKYVIINFMVSYIIHNNVIIYGVVLT